MYLLKKRNIQVLLNLFLNLINILFYFSWPIVVIFTKSLEKWGEIVDVWLIISLMSIFISWGSDTYLSKRIASQIEKFDFHFLENFYSRVIVLAVILLIVAFAPFEPVIIGSLLLCIISRTISSSLEIYFIFKNEAWKNILSSLVGIFFGFAFYFYNIEYTSTKYIILSICVGEFIKSFCFIMMGLKIFENNPVTKLNVQLLMNSYGFFLFNFTYILTLVTDRFFIYSQFSFEEKGLYQIYMNVFTFTATIPVFIIRYLMKYSKKGRLKIDNKFRLRIFLFSLPIFITILLFTYFIISTYISNTFTFAHLAYGILYTFPSIIYAPLIIYFSNKNNYFILSRSTISIAILLGALCIILIPRFGVEGGIYSGIISQWVFAFILVVLYEQDQFTKKIKIIK